jgi:DNA modification methylase
VRPYYEQDGITIFHADCRDLLPSLKADCVVTDPPYGVSYRQPRACTGRMSLSGDGAWSFVRPELPFVVWGANNGDGYSDCGWLVWDKMRYGLDLFGDGELAACSELRGVRVHPSRWDRQHGAGWTGLHPTEKPVGLIAWCLGFMPPGVVLDPYCGAGSTLIAARDATRKAIGIEIEERYCEIAAKRLAQGVLPFTAAHESEVKA